MRRMRDTLAAIAEERDKSLRELEPISPARLALLNETAGRKFQASTAAWRESAPGWLRWPREPAGAILVTACLCVGLGLLLVATWKFPRRETTSQQQTLSRTSPPGSTPSATTPQHLTLRMSANELAAFRVSALALNRVEPAEADPSFAEVRLDLPVRAFLHDGLARTP